MCSIYYDAYSVLIYTKVRNVGKDDEFWPADGSTTVALDGTEAT